MEDKAREVYRERIDYYRELLHEKMKENAELMSNLQKLHKSLTEERIIGGAAIALLLALLIVVI